MDRYKSDSFNRWLNDRFEIVSQDCSGVVFVKWIISDGRRSIDWCIVTPFLDFIIPSIDLSIEKTKNKGIALDDASMDLELFSEDREIIRRIVCKLKNKGMGV